MKTINYQSKTQVLHLVVPSLFIHFTCRPTPLLKTCKQSLGQGEKTQHVCNQISYLTFLAFGIEQGVSLVSDPRRMSHRWSPGPSFSNSVLISLVCSFMSLMKSFSSWLLCLLVCKTSRFLRQCCTREPMNKMLDEADDHLVCELSIGRSVDFYVFC